MSATAPIASGAAAWKERIVEFDCQGDRLFGVLAMPEETAPRSPAVLIVVGGPQYRAGSHRLFVLLARRLAGAGFPVLRFDCRGMGDSEGKPRTFDTIACDVDAALDALRNESGVARLAVFGLCDAASAALMFATAHRGVHALALVNPWVRSAESLATTHVKHYYGRRLLQVQLWRKVLTGRFEWRQSLRSAAHDVGAMLARRLRPAGASASFQSRMADGLRRFPGPVLLVLSGNDLTAREFVEYAGSTQAWHSLLASRRVERFDLPEADHTFSMAESRVAVEEKMLAWLHSL